ncbi:MAG TPA: insulinase family protein, partial [Bacteroidia bacterium]|nr:insulinase family protein [Bacteroidia bacterium]
MKIKSLIIAFLLLALFVQAQEIVELKTTASNLIVIKLQFQNGSICDPKGKEGLTELTASLITDGGTKDLSSTQIKDKMYPWAAQFGSSVDKEVSVFTFIVHRDFLDKFYEIVRGLMLTPLFAEEDFNRVKSNQQNYVDQVIRSSSDEEYSKKALEDFLFRGTNYQRMVEGNSAGVKAITLDDVKNHYKNYFTRNNLMIGIAGDYSADFLVKLTADIKNLSDAKPEIPAAEKAAMPDGINVEIVAKENALGSAVFAGFPMDITRSNDEFAALMVANSWLGEHRKSYSRL